jgi:hypothetical protein
VDEHNFRILTGLSDLYLQREEKEVHFEEEVGTGSVLTLGAEEGSLLYDNDTTKCRKLSPPWKTSSKSTRQDISFQLRDSNFSC